MTQSRRIKSTLIGLALLVTTPAWAQTRQPPLITVAAADRPILISPLTGSSLLTNATPDAPLRVDCTVTPTLTPTPTSTRAPNGDPLDPPSLNSAGAQVWTSPNGEIQTLLPYVLNGTGTLGVRLWTDTTRVHGIVGWMPWGFGRDDRGTFLDLKPTAMPDNSIYSFVVVFDGDLLQVASAAVHWELVGATASGETAGIAAAPRALPVVGKLYLPVLLR